MNSILICLARKTCMILYKESCMCRRPPTFVKTGHDVSWCDVICKRCDSCDIAIHKTTQCHPIKYAVQLVSWKIYSEPRSQNLQNFSFLKLFLTLNAFSDLPLQLKCALFIYMTRCSLHIFIYIVVYQAESAVAWGEDSLFFQCFGKRLVIEIYGEFCINLFEVLVWCYFSPYLTLYIVYETN
jgi:hypothetical protein